MICTFFRETSEVVKLKTQNKLRYVASKKKKKRIGGAFFVIKMEEKARGITEADSKNQVKTFRLTFLSH